jgi:tetratricopeptide (TPR) repeat protein
MRKIFTGTALLLLVITGNAQTLKAPAPSSTQTIKQTFALSSIELSYSRPGVKNRKIFGELVPFNQVWRTGANGATTLTFGDTVFINGTKLAPGTYGLLSIPNEKSWTLIISRQTNVTSAGAYRQDQDLLRYEAKTVELTNAVETFTMQFANIKDGSCDLQIMWDKTMVTLPVTTNIEGSMLAQINQVMKDSRPYYAAAMYYMNNGQDLNQALEWMNKAIEQNPKDLRNPYQKANLLVKMGKDAEARTVALKGLETANAEKNENYIKMFEAQLKNMKK